MLQKAEQAEPGDALTPEEAIRDPFVLEFLALRGPRKYQFMYICDCAHYRKAP